MALQNHQPQLCTAVVQKNHPSCGGPERLFVSTVLCPPSPGHNHSICLLQMLVSAAHVCPWKSQRSSSAASWNPMVMRWWQTQVVSPIVSLIQTFRLQFKGSCIPASYSLKLAYLVSKLWSHPLWGMLCAVLREQTWMSLLLVFEGFFPPALLLPCLILSQPCQLLDMPDDGFLTPMLQTPSSLLAVGRHLSKLFPSHIGKSSNKNWGKWHVGTWTSVLFSTTATIVTGNFAVLWWVPMSVTISACIALYNYLLKCGENLSAVQASGLKFWVHMSALRPTE